MTQPGFSAYGSPYGPSGGDPSGHGGYGGYGGYGAPPPGPSIPPNPTRPKRSMVPLILAGAGAFVVLAGVVVGGAVYWKLRSKAVALPVDAKMLPAQTSEIATQLIEATRETDVKVRRAYLAAELGSELCRPGVANPARRIEGLGSGGTKAAKELFFQKKQLDDMRATLGCGALLGESLDSPYQAVIAIEGVDGKKMQRVGVGHFTITSLPEQHGFTPFSYRGVPGFCRTQGEDRAASPFSVAPASRPGVCDETDLGAFAQGTTWFVGDRAALQTMAGSVKNSKEALNVRLAALKDAAAATQGMPVVRLQAQPKSSREFFMSPCMFGASHSAAPFTAFLDGCFPVRGQERLLEEIDSKIKAAAYETDGDPQKAGAFQGNVIFVARDDSAAKDVELDVREIVTEWKHHLDDNEAKLINQSNELAGTARTKKFAAIADTYFKALKGANVTRKGRTIRIAFKEALSPADLAGLDEADRTTVEKRTATAEILSAIEARQPVPVAALGKLVGPAWAAFLSGPAPLEAPPSARLPMSSEECRRLQGRIAPFTTSNFFTTDARLMFFSHKYASCATRPPAVDDVQRACLTSFKTAFEYARCAAPDLGATVPSNQPPESDFGDRRLER